MYAYYGSGCFHIRVCRFLSMFVELLLCNGSVVICVVNPELVAGSRSQFQL